MWLRCGWLKCFMSFSPNICARSKSFPTPHLISWYTPGLATNSIFFCFLFMKNHWFACKANQWPLIGETLISSVPPSNSLVSVSDPWRAYWADTPPFKGPRLASCVASGTSEIQGHRQVCRARRGGPRTLSTTTGAQTLIVCLLKTPFIILDFE